MGWIKKAETEDKTVDSRCAAYDDNMAGEFPALHEYMTLKTLADGKTRQTASLTLFCEDGLFKGCLNERDQGVSLWATSATLDELLRTLDALLQSETTPWRKNKAPHGKGKKA